MKNSKDIFLSFKNSFKSPFNFQFNLLNGIIGVLKVWEEIIVSKNDLANALGWGVIVIGIIGSFLAGTAYRLVSYSSSGYVNGSYNFGVAISGIIASVLFGIIFIFIGEILTTEYENRDKIASLYDQMNNGLNKDSM